MGYEHFVEGLPIEGHSLHSPGMAILFQGKATIAQIVTSPMEKGQTDQNLLSAGDKGYRPELAKPHQAPISPPHQGNYMGVLDIEDN